MAKKIFFFSLLILVLSFFLSSKIKESEPIPQNFNIDQIEITKKGPLLNSKGQLIDVGWSRYPLKEYNLEELEFPFYKKLYLKLRVKKWDFFSITNENFIIFVALVDVGYIGKSFIQIINLKNKEKQSIYVDILPFFKPKSFKDSFNFTLDEAFFFKSNSYYLSYKDSPSNGKAQIKYRHIIFETSFEGKKITGNFTLEKSVLHQDIVTMTPMNSEKTHFFYNVKSYTLPVEGGLQIGNETHGFKKNSSSAGICRKY
jgi:hypothetical protein